MPVISVEVVYALADRQTIVRLRLDSMGTVRQAIKASGILRTHQEIDLEQASIGIWSKAVTLDDGLREGDRIEIYRALAADPKTIRRRRAREATPPKRSRQNN